MAAVLVFALKWMQWRFLILDSSLELYIGLIAVFFTVLGVWIATKLIKPRHREVEIAAEKERHSPQPNGFTINTAALEELNLSSREYEVLQLLAKGLSNSDIAGQLYLSVSTVKTHVSNLYMKMDVNSRTQALDKALRLQIMLQIFEYHHSFRN